MRGDVTGEKRGNRSERGVGENGDRDWGRYTIRLSLVFRYIEQRRGIDGIIYPRACSYIELACTEAF